MERKASSRLVNILGWEGEGLWVTSEFERLTHCASDEKDLLKKLLRALKLINVAILSSNSSQCRSWMNDELKMTRKKNQSKSFYCEK